MRLYTACLLFPALLFTSPLFAEQECTGPEYRQFDFWIGDWSIEQSIFAPEGKTIELDGRTSVTKAADGCALVEHWTGRVQFPWEGMTEPEPMKGLSVRYFHPDEGKWFIHWLDSRNPSFGRPFKGIFEDGVGRFFLTRETTQGPRESRITFRQTDADEVLWELAIEQQPGEWTTFWVMNMHRSGTG